MAKGASKFPALRDINPQIPYFFYPWTVIYGHHFASTYCITFWSNSNIARFFSLIRISNQQSCFCAKRQPRKTTAKVDKIGTK